jgi:hypothetical protein
MPNAEMKAEIKAAVEKEVDKQEGTSGRPGFFVSFNNINWPKYAGLLTALVAIWGTMAWLIPLGLKPEHFALIGGLLGTLAFTVGYLARSSKWVSERQDLPPQTPGEQL